MRGTRALLPSLFLLVPALAPAQERKPGLYEVTVTTVTASPNPGTTPARTRQVCLTQQMIDKYGAIVPDNLRSCQLTNVVKKTGGMSADIECNGAIAGKGTLVVNWSDSEHAKGVIQFSGTMHPGDKDIKLEWTADTLSVYKGPDCKPVQPATPLPQSPRQTPPQ